MPTPSDYLLPVDGDPTDPPPGPGVSDEEIAEMIAEFDKEVDDYVAEWEQSLREKVTENFDPNQPRDNHGRWFQSEGVGETSPQSVPQPTNPSDAVLDYVNDAIVMAESDFTKQKVEQFTEKFNKHDSRWQKTVDAVVKLGVKEEKLLAGHDKEAHTLVGLMNQYAVLPAGDPGKKGLEDKIDRQAEKVDAALSKLLVARRGQEEAAWKEIRKAVRGEGDVVKTVIMGRVNLSARQAGEVVRVERLLAGSVSSKLLSRVSEAKVEMIPTQERQRAHFVGRRHGGNETMFIAAHNDAETIAHEFGHALETNASVYNAARGFLYKRVGSEVCKPLGSGYSDWEVGRDDNWGKAFGASARYVGKHYKSFDTEVTSMGLEQMVRDPVKFARDDPEHFKFVVGVLDGTFAGW